MKYFVMLLVACCLTAVGCEPTKVPAPATPVVAPAAPVTAPEAVKTIKLSKDSKGEWRWSLQGANNKIIGASSESFHNKADAIGNAKLNYGAGVNIVE